MSDESTNRNDGQGYLRNPAGRLYTFLKYIRENGVANGPIFQVVAEYLGLQPNFTPTFFAALADLMAQPDLMRSQVEALVDPPLPASVLLEELPAVEGALAVLAPSMHNQIQGPRDQYNEGTLKSLQHASHILNNATGFKTPVPDDALDEVKLQAEALIATLTADTTIDAELRHILFVYADGVRRSVDVFKINGLDGVLAEFDKLLGLFRRQPDVVAKVVAKPKLMEKMQGLLVALNIVAAAANVPVAIQSGVNVFQELTTTPTIVLAPADATHEAS